MKAVSPQQITPLASGTRSAVNTNAAAHNLNRTTKHLRSWASLENEPISPIRIHGRLAERVTDLQALVSGGAK